MVLQAKTEAKVIRNFVLSLKVFFELIVIFDYFVPAALELMNEGTRALVFVSLALSVRQEIRTILTRAKGALQSTAMTHL